MDASPSTVCEPSEALFEAGALDAVGAHADRNNTSDLAWRRLFDEHFRDVYRLAVRSGFGNSEAEDVAQKVFIRAHDRLRTIEPNDPIKNVRAWLRGITVRVASEHRRWARVRRLGAVLLGATENARAPRRAPDEDAGIAEERARIAKVLSRMSPKLREVLVLADLHDCEQAEVAVALGIPENTVRSRRARAREQFRLLWGEKDAR